MNDQLFGMVEQDIVCELITDILSRATPVWEDFFSSFIRSYKDFFPKAGRRLLEEQECA